MPDSFVNLTGLSDDAVNPPPNAPRAPQPWAQHGLINNETLAKQIARDILRSTFDSVPSEPLIATLKRGIWYIQDRPHPGEPGGNLYIQICRSNGRVLNVYGTQ